MSPNYTFYSAIFFLLLLAQNILNINTQGYNILLCGSTELYCMYFPQFKHWCLSCFQCNIATYNCVPLVIYLADLWNFQKENHQSNAYVYLELTDFVKLLSKEVGYIPTFLLTSWGLELHIMRLSYSKIILKIILSHYSFEWFYNLLNIAIG